MAARPVADSPEPGTASTRQPRSDRHDQGMALVLDVLRQCAATFGIPRVRFLRQNPAGDWIVHTMQQDTLITHTADYAESAMGWMVALSRFPLRVTRPRITSPGGEHVRPIAVTNYLGIPVLCSDQVVGVIELAGKIDGDPSHQVEAVSGIIADLGRRLMHDPEMQPCPVTLGPDTRCSLAGGKWGDVDIDLSPDVWTIASTISPGEQIAAIASRLDWPEETVISTVSELVAMGLIAVQADEPAGA